MKMRLSNLAMCLLLSTMVTPASAESPFVFGPEEVVPKSIKPGAKWKEGAVSLPAWPKDVDLIEIRLDRPDALFTYSIDRASLATGRDGVVRYTIVAEAGSGARNVTFEGIRCTPNGAYRIYAFGHGRAFKLATGGDDWQPIGASASDAVRKELWRHYLCVPRLFKPRPARDQLRMLRSGRVPEIENSGFLTN
ncbi:MAG: CNP1-like family protein [Chromatiaceae bacterium]|nr:CNP1-like family protein [Chromatiaceae bacterium]MCF7994633.1 CNP1-like family protein [Chromatiaceae bacterium]MCF8003428.1 CNP1-like family protein [Chromatiaceae bacterium]MCF8015096.1 CNP1-like family protein [Chromatiaceae bacterium]